MFTRIALLFLCLCCIAPSRSGAQVTETARGYIEDLCSPRMHGRGYALKGDRKASRYIACEYRKTGLKKVAGSWYQPFTVSINTQSSGLALRIDDREFTPGVEYIVAQGSPSFSGQCNLYHMDRSGLPDSVWMDQIPDGTFLLLDNNTGTGETEEQTSLLNELVARLEQSPPASCEGIIIYSDSKLTLKGFRERLPVPVIYLRSQEDLGNAVSLYLEVDSRYDPGYMTRNVMAFIPGEEYPDSLIIFTAHYDHLGTMGSGVYFPGANDNASGVAMILSLAGHYAGEEHRPSCSMLFIAFSAEEIGLLGSRYYVEHPVFPLENTKFLINIDLAGNGQEGITVVNGSVYRSSFDLLKMINDRELYLPAVKSRGEACNSDHCPFHLAGVPGFFIYTMGGSTAYHDIYDTPGSLPLRMFDRYFKLLVSFTDSIQQ